ncbi:hypothetical protein PR048_024713 [Dryococelus australis]|uniref:Uncharacterized protein n=1 Tax=Dryococelus australis TaxID=614101 RepID=A0ABQ9GPE9_9NEOP|nr:hypothetical protein PR048_024713 [Dryococelus australis]
MSVRLWIVAPSLLASNKAVYASLSRRYFDLVYFCKPLASQRNNTVRLPRVQCKCEIFEMPPHRQPLQLLTLCHSQVANNLVSTCRLLQLVAQDSSAAHALNLAKKKFRPLYFYSLPGPIRSQLIEEVSQKLSAPARDGSAAGAGPAPLYLLALLLGTDVKKLRVELCCYYGCSHQAALLKFLTVEGSGLETLELARSALLRLDKRLLQNALVSATSLRHLILRNIASDAVLQVVGTACPNLVALDVSNSRQVTDTGMRYLLLQVELRDKASPTTSLIPEANCMSIQTLGLNVATTNTGNCTGRGWGRLRTLLKLFPWLRLNRDGEGKIKDRSFLLEYCERRNSLCGTLRTLNIANTGVTSAGVLLALHHIPEIQSLGEYGHMGRALEILDRAWAASENSVECPSPHTFSLTCARSQRTTNRRIELLASACPALEKLTIFEPQHSPSALQQFPTTLTVLHLLNVPSDSNWINSLYSYLSSPHGHNLQDLTLRFTPLDKFASLDLSQILFSCPNLHTLIEDGADVDWKHRPLHIPSNRLLSLSHVQIGRTVTAQALSELLKRAPALRIAHFYSCPDLTDEHMINLATATCPYGQENTQLSTTLECFYIYEAPHVTAHAVGSLLATCDQLTKIGNLGNWGLDCDGIRWIHNTVIDNNFNLEINMGSHWYCSPCFPVT